MRSQHDTNETKTFPAQSMEQKLQDMPTMQKTILPKRFQRQQNILRQLQTRQHQSFGSPAILKQTQMETRSS